MSRQGTDHLVLPMCHTETSNVNHNLTFCTQMSKQNTSGEWGVGLDFEDTKKLRTYLLGKAETHGMPNCLYFQHLHRLQR